MVACVWKWSMRCALLRAPRLGSEPFAGPRAPSNMKIFKQILCVLPMTLVVAAGCDSGSIESGETTGLDAELSSEQDGLDRDRLAAAASAPRAAEFCEPSDCGGAYVP